jgi:hypothetical protein
MTKNFRLKNTSIPIIVLAALFCAVGLCITSCNLSGGPDFGTGTLTLLLPENAVEGSPVNNRAAGVSRSVLPDSFIGTLVYRVTFTGPGGTQTLEAGGGGTTVSLDAGQWTIKAAAYDPGDPAALVGSGEVVITVIAGQNISVRVPMRIDPAYEAGLLDIYIHNEAELRRIGAAGLAIDSPNRTFYLENDIVLTQPWTPIGNGGGPFKAAFDGQGHSITVKSFSGPILEGNRAALGFFAVVEGATIKNTTITYELGKVDISTGNGGTYYDGSAGGVAGFAFNNTSFANVQVNGNFSVTFDGLNGFSVGGIAGQASDVTITGCRVSGTISGTSANHLPIGGIAGMIASSSAGGGDIRECSFTGSVTGNSPTGGVEAGGIAGSMSGVGITACFAEGHIKGEAADSNVGGIAGTIDGSSGSRGINKSYAAGVIESAATGAYSTAGGIAGRVIYGSGTIENCYAWAAVSSSSTYGEEAGGIAGTTGGTISKSYAAGTVQSKGHDPYTCIGGIAGNSAAVGGCMALVSELDGGPSVSASRTVYKIGDSPSLNGNYSRNDIVVQNAANPNDPGINAMDGEARPLADFKSQTLYTNAGWNFAAGGDWKFLSGYDYPVLSWQTAKPGATLEEGNRGGGGIEIEWP